MKVIIVSILLVFLTSCSPSVDKKEKQYVEKEFVLQEAKRFEPGSQVQWTAEIVENKEVAVAHGTIEKRTVWVVEALYPAGNKMIILFDAMTGEGISMSEIEPSM